ncbi:hypothetical protein KEM54_000539 [Ascosphaera aggregata]|nr:hypothetical protein KEM54_000539 [Ascosphaera aggregata]
MLEVGGVSSPRTATIAAAPEADRAAQDTVGNFEETTVTTVTTATTSAIPASNSNDATSLNGVDTGNTGSSNSNGNNSNSQNDNNDISINNNSNSGSRTPVAKDKHCVYCHMAFTSSALGRHYDQFLFKKKPDGVHNVEEIRQMRSNITRRTARTSSAAAELAKQEPGFSNASVSDTGSVRSLRPGQSLPPSGGADSFAPIGDHRHSVSRSGVGAYQVYCNPLPYASPVVNNNSPGPSRAALTDSHGKTHIMRAMELALREALDTIKAAT